MGRKVWIVLSFLALTTVGSLQFSIKSSPERDIVATSDDGARHNPITGRPTGTRAGSGSQAATHDQLAHTKIDPAMTLYDKFPITHRFYHINMSV